MRVGLLNELYLPSPPPRFHLSFAFKGGGACWMLFKPNQAVASIFMGEAFMNTVFMLLHPRADIIRLANIQRTIALVCEDIDIEHYMNINRVREVGKVELALGIPPLIPVHPNESWDPVSLMVRLGEMGSGRCLGHSRRE